jgi:hypothetical protein
VIDLRWQRVECAMCGRTYRCTPNTDYYHDPTSPQEPSTSNGRCWECHLKAAGLPPQPEPHMGDPMFVEPSIT